MELIQHVNHESATGIDNLLILQESVFIRATPESILPSIKGSKSEQE